MNLIKRIQLILEGRDASAGKALDQVGNKATQTATKVNKSTGSISKMGGVVKGFLVGLVTTKLLEFGQASVDAFRDAEKSQRSLEDAYQRFPSVASLPIEALREYNAALQTKTGADADDLAASQAILARYKLTGDQLRDLTPLLVDYSAKTGKDLPTAAGVLGKALMGNGRALKELGIPFKSTGDRAKDLDAIMAGLRSQVGGFAEKEASSAEGKTKILSARIGDLQEAIGSKLAPALEWATDRGMDLLDWLDRNPQVIEGAAAAWNVFSTVVGGAVRLAWAALKPFLLQTVDGFALVARMAAGVADAAAAIGIPGAARAAADLRKMATGAEAVRDGIKSIPDDLNFSTRKAQSEAVNGKARIGELKSKIESLRSKIVTAKAKGDSAEVDRLKKRLDSIRSKTVQLTMHVARSGLHGLRAVPTKGGGVAMAAYAQGGRPRPGVAAQFHADEIWIPDRPGRVYTARQSREMAALGGSGTTVVIQATIAPQVPLNADRHAVAREITKALSNLAKDVGPLPISTQRS